MNSGSHCNSQFAVVCKNRSVKESFSRAYRVLKSIVKGPSEIQTIGDTGETVSENFIAKHSGY